MLDPANQKAYENHGNAARSFDKAMDDMQKHDVAGLRSGLPEKIQQLRFGQRETQDGILRLIKEGQHDEARALLNQQETPKWREMRQLILDEIKRLDEAEPLLIAKVQDHVTGIRLQIFIFSCLAVLVGLVFGIAITRSITQPLARLQAVLEQVETSGDCRLRVGLDTRDEAGRTAAAFDAMMLRIATIIGDTSRSAHAFADAAHATLLSGTQVAGQSSEQSGAAAEAAAAIEQTSVGISEIADSAKVASTTAAQVRERIRGTLDSVHDLSDNVGNLALVIAKVSQDISLLAESSKQIDGIVQTIREIADQTNLLALNAAIEAARAGAQGRGFAVVADEVRKLAENTAGATEEISGLIHTIQKQVNDAVDQMGHTNEQATVSRQMVTAAAASLNEVSMDTDHITNAMHSIASAVQEQDTAVRQVTQRIEYIAQMSETNNTAAHTAVETARYLDELAIHLRESVSHFKT
jgi:methyl-accepting chemotaxis protein